MLQPSSQGERRSGEEQPGGRIHELPRLPLGDGEQDKADERAGETRADRAGAAQQPRERGGGGGKSHHGRGPGGARRSGDEQCAGFASDRMARSVLGVRENMSLSPVVGRERHQRGQTARRVILGREAVGAFLRGGGALGIVKKNRQPKGKGQAADGESEEAESPGCEKTHGRALGGGFSGVVMQARDRITWRDMPLVSPLAACRSWLENRPLRTVALVFGRWRRLSIRRCRRRS